MAAKKSPCARQVSGHDFSVLPDASSREQGAAQSCRKNIAEDFSLRRRPARSEAERAFFPDRRSDRIGMLHDEITKISTGNSIL